MGKKAAAVEGALSELCNTMLTQGMKLEDKPLLQQRLYESAKLFAQAVDPSDRLFASNLFPSNFFCSHCGEWHGITWEELKKALFGPGGQLDFSAAHDELKAILNYREAAAAGKDWNNNTAANSDVNLSEMIKETPADAGTNSGTDGTQPGS